MSMHRCILLSHYISSKFGSIVLIIIASLLFGCESKSDDPPGEFAQYRSGLNAYKQQNYSSALDIFNQQLNEFPQGEYADNAYLYRGRSNYWLHLYPQSLSDFQTVLTIPSSDVLDSGQYWLAKAHHALGQLLKAREEYDKVDPSGIWYDNSRFQVARTYFDESLLQTDPAQEFVILSSAVTKLNEMILTFPTSSSIDGAYYYLGRSYHNQFRLVEKDPQLGVNNDPGAPQTYSDYFTAARAAYGLVDPLATYADDAHYFDIRLSQESSPTRYDAGYYESLRKQYLTFTTDFPNSSRVDDAQYQIGKTHYDQAQHLLIENQPTAAMDNFASAIMQLGPLTTTDVNNNLSGLADGASYYQGRSYHEQALLTTLNSQLASDTTADALFDSARQAYQAVALLDSTSNWIDNAQYQLASTYYAQAKSGINIAQLAIASALNTSVIQTHYDAVQFNLDQAIDAYQVILTNPQFSDSSSVDNAQYYSGRAYARAAAIPTPYRVDLSPDGINFIGVNYQDAIDQFTPLTTEAKFSNSIWVDNAYYQIGNALFQSALLATADIALQKSYYESALTNYAIVIENFPSSIRLDNSAYKIALVYHNTGYCQQEQDWLVFTVSLPTASATIVRQSNTHLTDLSLSLVTPTLIHPCVNDGNPGQPQPTLPPPPAVNTELKAFQENLALFRQGLYNEAITQFQNQLLNFANGVYADDANLYIGRSYYELLNYNQSLVYFSVVITDWSTSDSVNEAQYWAGRGQHLLGFFDLARQYYNNVDNSSPWRDNASYNIAKSHYDESKTLLDPSQALAEMELAKLLFSDFLLNYIGSPNIDNAQYFLGRSYHRMANLLIANTELTSNISALQALDLARMQYSSIISTSSYADDVQYQLGRTHYDNVRLLLLPSEQLVGLQTAEQFFLQFHGVNSLANSNAAHSAIYFLGRSRHKIAELLYADETLAPTLTALTVMIEARIAYTDAISKNMLGSYVDNAHYQLGRSHYSDALNAATVTEQFASYEAAISLFTRFDIGGTNALSTLAHNALYFAGRSRHQQLDLLLVDPSLSGTITDIDALNFANTAYLAAITNNPVGQYADNATYYLGRIAYDQALRLTSPAEQMAAYEQAIAYFSQFDVGGNYAGYGFSHNGLYYLGLSLDAQSALVQLDPTLSTKTAAQLSTEAGNAFQAALIANSTGIYADNLAYQIGRNYFDNAKILVLTTDAFAEYSNAITTLSDFSVGGIYENSFYAQRGRFFLAQSWHRQALLLHQDPSLSTVTFGQAFINTQTAYVGAVIADPLGIYADNAQYELGKSHYDYAGLVVNDSVRFQNYDTAITAFAAFDVTGAYSQSNYNDQASFYKARSYHQQALLLHLNPNLLITTTVNATMLMARQQYLATITLNPAGSYADNARYQIGASHYDQAVWSQELAEQGILTGMLSQDIQLLYTDMQVKLESAIVEFRLVLADYAATNSADNAQFFLSRSHHRAVNIPAQYQIDLSATTPGATDFTAITHTDVRTLYMALFDAVNFPNSPWVDNAYYEIGTSFAEQAFAEANITPKVDLYNNALTNYDTVINTYPDSARVDDAIFSIALVYHHTGHCVTEQSWLNSVIAGAADPLLIQDANLHLMDLTQTIPLNHGCNNTDFGAISQLVAP